MRFDHTQVTIRGRQLPDIADLALLTLGQFPRLWYWLLVGILPFALCQSALLWWLPGIEERDLENIGNEMPGAPRFLWHYILLGTLLVPLASLPATLYLGQVMFEERPASRDIWRGIWALSGKWLWRFGVWSGAIWYVIALATLPHNSQWQPFREVVLPVVLTLLAWFSRARSPFHPEILALERCPIRKRSNQLTARQRSRSLHLPNRADLLGNAFLLLPTYGLTFLLTLFSLAAIRRLLIGDPIWDRATLQVLVPVSFWMVAGFAIVVRYLSYLDLRIRQEGWEVELLLRAEAARLTAVPLPPTHPPPTAATPSGMP